MTNCQKQAADIESSPQNSSVNHHSFKKITQQTFEGSPDMCSPSLLNPAANGIAKYLSPLKCGQRPTLSPQSSIWGKKESVYGKGLGARC